MGIIWFVIQLLIGAMILFFLSHAIYNACEEKKTIVWLLALAVMSFLVMGAHRLLGSTINPPLFTLLLFAASTSGHFLFPKSVKPKALWAIAIGGISGWVLYIEPGVAA